MFKFKYREGERKKIRFPANAEIVGHVELFPALFCLLYFIAEKGFFKLLETFVETKQQQKKNYQTVMQLK